MWADFSSLAIGIHSIFSAMNDIIVDSVFNEGADIWSIKQPFMIGFIVSEQ